MFARSTTITGGPGNVDAGISYIRDEVMPAVTGMDGCIGLSMLVNRDSGRCIATSSWSSEEAMRASDAEVAPHRSRAADVLGGGAPQVEEWEIALMHREHEAREGSWCRVTWTQVEPSGIDEMLDFYKDNVLNRLEETEGFCSASVLVNRSTGRCCGTARFDSRAALDATREMAERMRAERAETGSIAFTEIDECELVIAHLRVPELV
jgi:heme-degrading monooxygenase HmoA